MTPIRRSRIGRIALVIAVSGALVIGGTLKTPVSANGSITNSSTTHSITVSGDCSGGANNPAAPVGVSNWQTVFDNDPTLNGGTTNPLYLMSVDAIRPGDSMKIINNCQNGATLYLTRPGDLTFAADPVFSSGAGWDSNRQEGAIPNQGFGQVQLSASTVDDMSLGAMVKFGDPTDIWNSRYDVFAPWNYGEFTFDQASATLGGTSSNSFALGLNRPIDPITLGVTPGFAISGGSPVDVQVRGGNYFPLSGGPVPSLLPPGLSFTCAGREISEQSSQIGCTLPATIEGTPTQAGTFSVNLVFNQNGSSRRKLARQISFSVSPAPTVSAVNPASGAAAGGTAITITGTNFGNGSTVTVGGAACANVTLVSATSIMCTTPVGTPGAVSVVVTSGGQSNSANTLFTYDSPPTTTTVAPTTSTTVPQSTTTTTVPVGSGSSPTLVTSTNRAQLEADPGEATALINGVPVAVETVKVDPATATPADLLETAKEIVSEISKVLPAGATNTVKVVETDDGAELSGLMTNPEDPAEKLNVPVESVTLVKAGNTAVLISALNQTNLPAEIVAGGVMQVTRGGLVAAKAFGLPGSETGEIVLMSTPRLLKTFTVAPNGSYSGQVPLPKDISFGSHTVVMATSKAKVSLGIKLVRTRMQFRIKRSIGTTIFRNRAGVVKNGGGKVTISASGRCRANARIVKMAARPGACFVTVRQAAKGKNKAIFYRFTVSVVTKAPKKIVKK